jgi:hypothetical protein
MFEAIENLPEDDVVLAPNNHTSLFVSTVWDALED